MKIKIPILGALKKVFPNGLYTRSLIIIIAPIVILQAVLTFVFLERHWQLVTKKLSSSVVAEIGMMIDMQENNDFEKISSNAKEFYDIKLSFLANEKINYKLSSTANLVEKTLSQELNRNLGKNYSIEDLSKEKRVIVRVEIDSGVLEFVIPRRNVMRRIVIFF